MLPTLSVCGDEDSRRAPGARDGTSGGRKIRVTTVGAAEDEVVELASELIRIDTTNTGELETTTGEREAAEYVAGKLTDAGFEVEEYHLAHAMREVAHEIRERQYEALERLGALVDGPQGEDLDARVTAACDREYPAGAGGRDAALCPAARGAGGGPRSLGRRRPARRPEVRDSQVRESLSTSSCRLTSRLPVDS